MTSTFAGVLFIASLIVALALSHRPLGDYMASVFRSSNHWRFERAIYRVAGINPDADQKWPTYVRSVLAFSLVSALGLYLILRAQHELPFNLGDSAMEPAQSFNTAASFVTNTDWQSYSGESTLGYVAQMAGLAVQNFASAAAGIAVAIAVIRGFARTQTDRLGNFWVDLVRAITRILLPMSIIFAVLLLAGGVIDNFHGTRLVHTIAGNQQAITGGPVASQEAIKELGTNGGGFYNANSAHPFENPTSWTNWCEIYALLVIAFSLPRTFGRMVGNNRQGLAIVSVMAALAIASVVGVSAAEFAHHGTVPSTVGASMEGKEMRFGVADSATFAAATTLTSAGAVDSMHDSYTSLGGAVLLIDMQLGEVAPGGVGSGLYGMLVLAVITVFVAGLMVGRTPEYLGKKIAAREIKFASMYFLATPIFVLAGTGLAMALPGERAAMGNPGSHGLSEVLYAFTSAGNNNGSAFAGLAVDTDWYNTALGIVMLGARFIPMILVMGMAGSLARQQRVPASTGTLSTDRALFAGMLAAVTLVVVALTYLPALALGPLAEGLH
jgi:potassium-transporting ATPase potassium-binding subunit